MSSNSGAGWLRVGTSWQNLEPQKGVYSMPSDTFAALQRCQRYGMKVCFVVGGDNTNYAHEATDYVQGYANAMAWLVKNYSQYLGAVEVVNEPSIDWQFPFVVDDRGNWCGVNDDDSTSNWLLRYLPLLNAAVDAIKAVNPKMQVIGSGGPQSANFREITLGLNPRLDGTVEHPYSQNNPFGPMTVTMPEIVQTWAGGWTVDGQPVADNNGSFASMVDNLRAYARQKGVTTRIWHTEFGYSTVKPHPPDYPAGMTEEKQGLFILRRLLEAAGLGVEKTFVYNWKDWDFDPFNTDNNFGIIKADGSLKRSFYAMQRAARLLQNAPTPERGGPLEATIIGDPVDPSGLGYRCYTFSSADKKTTTVVFWEATSFDRFAHTPTKKNATIVVPRRVQANKVFITNAMNGFTRNATFTRGRNNSITVKVATSETPQVLVLQAAEKGRFTRRAFRQKH